MGLFWQETSKYSIEICLSWISFSNLLVLIRNCLIFAGNLMWMCFQTVFESGNNFDILVGLSQTAAILTKVIFYWNSIAYLSENCYFEIHDSSLQPFMNSHHCTCWDLWIQSASFYYCYWLSSTIVLIIHYAILLSAQVHLFYF